MHAPAFVCEGLFRRNPTVRLAWQGRPKQNPDELNAGSFMLVKLKPLADVGDLGDPITFCAPWYVQPEPGEDGTLRMVKYDRGPIFSRKGLCRSDWDPLFFVPVIRENLEQHFSREDILNGRFLEAVLPYTYSKRDTYNDSVEAMAKEVRRSTDDMGREMGKHWRWLGRGSDQSTPLTTKEERIKAVADMYAKGQKNRSDDYIRTHKL